MDDARYIVKHRGAIDKRNSWAHLRRWTEWITWIRLESRAAAVTQAKALAAQHPGQFGVFHRKKCLGIVGLDGLFHPNRSKRGRGASKSRKEKR